jgi:hypothetical protein
MPDVEVFTLSPHLLRQQRRDQINVGKRKVAGTATLHYKNAITAGALIGV